jgi:hypothetical protein
VRVLVSPNASVAPNGRAIAAGLAGDGSDVIDLAQFGVRNLSRRLSRAEIHALRKALLGLGLGQEPRPRDPDDGVVGYVCTGVSVSDQVAEESMQSAGDMSPVAGLVAVTDHANLTWYSPLTGPNDDSLGPRFPVTAGLYRVDAVTSVLPAAEAIVAAVWDDADLSPFEERVIREGPKSGGPRFAAASAELSSVAILAAHLGYGLAAAMIIVSEE